MATILKGAPVVAAMNERNAALCEQLEAKGITPTASVGVVFLGKGGNGRKELVLEGYFNYALRDGDWVMIPPYPDTYGDAEEAAFAGNSNCYQLYNVKEDIGQQVNLAEKEPKRLRQMMMTFERLKRETGKITNF